MKATQAVLYGAGDLRLDEIDLGQDRLDADHVLVRTIVTAFSSGTDLGNYEGRSTEVPGAPGYPRAIGYSNVGRVAATGSAVQDLRPGERVFSLKPHQSAYLARASELLLPVPEGVASETASLAYLTQLGVAALRQARYEAGENVAVVGLGVIGLCTVAIARVMGANVAAVANSPQRAESARQLGAQSVFLSGEFGRAADSGRVFGGEGAGIVVLTADTWDAYRVALDLVGHGGRVAILGFPGRAQPRPDFNPLGARWLYGKQISLIGAGLSPRLECAAAEVRFNLRRNLAYILDLMADGRVDLASVISHRFPAQRMAEAYELARSHSKALIAAIFDWEVSK